MLPNSNGTLCATCNIQPITGLRAFGRLPVPNYLPRPSSYQHYGASVPTLTYHCTGVV